MITAEHIHTLTIIWIGIALLLFPALLKVTAPYGRHSKRNWGPMISNSLGWFIMESPSLLIYLYWIIRKGDFSNIIVVTASLLWIAHYFHRAIVYPLRLHTKGKKMPLLIMAFAFFFNLVNGTINGYAITHFTATLSGWRIFSYVLGVTLFITGFIVNQYHDKILIDLRKQNGNSYKIPYGGLFKQVSCPNFFGEVLEWGGYAVLCLTLPSLAFFIWTFVNLVPRALDHHKWYKTKFEGYPEKRKAIFPKIL